MTRLKVWVARDEKGERTPVLYFGKPEIAWGQFMSKNPHEGEWILVKQLESLNIKKGECREFELVPVKKKRGEK